MSHKKDIAQVHTTYTYKQAQTRTSIRVCNKFKNRQTIFI